jgi:GNAT superfamily N-acetyltransferase
MAALSRSPRVRVRAAVPGEGAAVAALWRELWDAHETWGGYPGSRDPRVYAQLAARLDEDARVRAGHPVLGRHVHVVADLGGAPCGQVEGWVDRHGVEPSTPTTCEVRSLVVSRGARGQGVGRALLDALASATAAAAHGMPCVLAAEVLAANPANVFYDRVGYRPVAWSARVEAAAGASIAGDALTARLGAARDHLAVAWLEAALAARRRDAGDARFDGQCPVDGRLVEALALQLELGGDGSQRDPTTLVAVDAGGAVLGSGSFAVHALEPPFAPCSRALAGRFSIAEARHARPAVAALVSLACRLALAHGARFVELIDLPAPGTAIHEAALAAGARPWSRVVTRPV